MCNSCIHNKVCSVELKEKMLDSKECEHFLGSIPTLTLFQAIDRIFSHNELLTIFTDSEEYVNTCIWRGIAWELPNDYKNIKEWKVIGVIPDSINDFGSINVHIKI